MHYYWGNADDFWFTMLPLFVAPFALSIIILALWSLMWKGLALWHASRRGEPWWFIAILFINTFGILEIIYLFWVAKVRFDDLFVIHKTHTTHTAHTTQTRAVALPPPPPAPSKAPRKKAASRKKSVESKSNEEESK